jgi:hypothetical protein
VFCVYCANRTVANITNSTLRCKVKLRTLKLGTVCQDRATLLTGTLTHWLCDMDHCLQYLFQPRGLDNDGVPIKCLVLELSRLVVKEDDFEEVEVPFEILGTEVTDTATTFQGMAVEFIRHINGCFHVMIQPTGRNESTKQPFKKLDFDLRRCTGPKIIEFSEKELAKSIEKKPSPIEVELDRDYGSIFNELSDSILGQ